jgi:hypothetical protein
MGNVVANLVMNEALDYVLLVGSHDYATHMRVKWFGKEIPRVSGISAVFKRYQMASS